MRTTSNSFGLRRRPRLIEFLSPRMVFLLASDGVTTNFSNFRIFPNCVSQNSFKLVIVKRLYQFVNSFNSLLPRLSVNTNVCPLSLQMSDEPKITSMPCRHPTRRRRFPQEDGPQRHREKGSQIGKHRKKPTFLPQNYTVFWKQPCLRTQIRDPQHICATI